MSRHEHSTPTVRAGPPAKSRSSPLAPHAHGAQHRRAWWNWLRRVGLFVLTVAALEYLAVPQLVQGRSELRLFSDASPWMLGSALALETGSVASYTMLTLAVLPSRARSRFVDQFRIDLIGLGASHVVPGGGASAAALRFRLMVDRGVSGADAASTAAVQGAIALIGLTATFIGGVTLALPGISTHPVYLAAAATGLLLLTIVGIGVVAAARRPPGRTSRAMKSLEGGASTSTAQRARRIRGTVTALVAVVRDIGVRAVDLARQPGRRAALFGWAAGNWLLDAACLWLCLYAYGAIVPPGPLLAAYGAANLIGLLPVTPGGLGVVEGILIPSITTLGGVSVGSVVLGVLTWRACEFWLPIPVSGISYVSLRPWRAAASIREGPAGQPLSGSHQSPRASK